MSRYIFVTLFLYISFVPFYYFQEPVFDHVPAQVALIRYAPVFMVCLLIIQVVFFIKKDHKNAISIIKPLKGFVLSLAGYYLLSVFALLAGGFSKELTVIGFLKLHYYFLTGPVFFLLALILLKKEHFEVLIQSGLVISGLVSLYGIVQYWSGIDFFWGDLQRENNPYYSGVARAGSTLGNANVAGTYYVIFCFIASVLWKRKQIDNHFFLLLIPIYLIGTMVTFFLSAWGALLVFFLITIIHFSKQNKNIRHQTVHYSLILYLLFPAVHLVFPELITPFIDKISALTTDIWEDSVRINAYKATYKVLCDYPLVGMGFGLFTRKYHEYAPMIDFPSWVTPVHTTENMFLMVLCEGGSIGFFLFIAQFYFLYVSQHEESSRSIIASYFAVMLIFFLTWDLLNHPTIRIVFWFGLAAIIQRKKDGPT